MAQGIPRRSAVRKPTQADVWIEHATEFTARLVKQLGITLLATLLGAGRDWLMKKSSAEVSSRLSGNLGGSDDEDKKNFYAPSRNYNSGYDRSHYNHYRNNGSETFPGF